MGTLTLSGVWMACLVQKDVFVPLVFLHFPGGLLFFCRACFSSHTRVHASENWSRLLFTHTVHMCLIQGNEGQMQMSQLILFLAVPARVTQTEAVVSDPISVQKKPTTTPTSSRCTHLKGSHPAASVTSCSGMILSVLADCVSNLRSFSY